MSIDISIFRYINEKLIDIFYTSKFYFSLRHTITTPSNYLIFDYIMITQKKS